MNKGKIVSYIRTAFITLIIMLISVLGVVIDARNKARIIPVNKTYKEYEKEQIIYLIDKYKYEAKTNDSYMLCIKLGLLYENIQEYDLAEVQYKKAIARAPYRVFEPIFMLCELYVKRGEPDKAIQLIDNVKDYPDNKLIKEKAILYKKIAEEYLKQKSYEKAIRTYKNSIFYIKKIELANDKPITQINKGLTQAYIGLSNLYMEQGKYNRALNTAIAGEKLTKSPLLLNHIATIAKDKNPEIAITAFDRLFKLDKNLINYENYASCIEKLMVMAMYSGDFYKEKRYKERLHILENFIDRSIMKKNDVIINFKNSKYKKFPLNMGEEVIVTYSISNNQVTTLNRLYMVIKVYSNGELKKEMSNKIIERTNVLKAGGRSSLHKLYINIPYKEAFVTTDSVKIDIYLTKHEKINPIFVESILIPKIQSDSILNFK